MKKEEQTEPIPSESPVFQEYIPKEKLSIILSDERYIEYKSIFERILLKKKISAKEKNSEILNLALQLLARKVETLKAGGKTFVTPEEILD